MRRGRLRMLHGKAFKAISQRGLVVVLVESMLVVNMVIYHGIQASAWIDCIVIGGLASKDL